MTPHQVSVAAESHAASLFAQAGFDVLVQYGANLPNYDLVIVGSERQKTVSVKGSNDGGWALAVSKKRKGKGMSYHEAIDRWLECQRPSVIFCFVQFRNVSFGAYPRTYLAHAPEVASRLKEQCLGRGHLALFEDYRSIHPKSKYDDRIAAEWVFTLNRLGHLFSALA